MPSQPIADGVMYKTKQNKKRNQKYPPSSHACPMRYLNCFAISVFTRSGITNHSFLQGFRVPTGVKEPLLKTAVGRWCQGMRALSPSGLNPPCPSRCHSGGLERSHAPGASHSGQIPELLRSGTSGHSGALTKEAWTEQQIYLLSAR